MAAAGAGGAGEEETDEEGEGGGSNGGGGGDRKKDAGVLAATGASGAVIGWNLAHSLGMGLDLVGALGGELLLQLCMRLSVHGVGMLVEENT